jgi:putative transposase
MPRRPRLAAGDLAYHVLNRRVGRLPLLETPAEYTAFEKILAEAHAQTGIRIAAYCLMPTHWHLLLWPRRDGELSEVLNNCNGADTFIWPSSLVLLDIERMLSAAEVIRDLCSSFNTQWVGVCR